MKFVFLFFALTSAVSIKAEPVLSVNQIQPGVYVHWGVQEFSNTKNHGAVANIGFIIGGRCVAVIDSGGNLDQGRALKNAIENVTSKPICYVINTHVHPDHIYGNSVFKDTSAKFVGHEKLARAMSVRGEYYVQNSKESLGITLSPKDIVSPDITVSKELDLDLGGRILKLTAHPPSHTDNDLSIYDPQTDTLWLADLLFIEHLPSIDGSLKGWLDELAKLEVKSYKTVIPGHGPLVTDWPKSMQPEKEYLSALLLEVRTAIKKGVFLEDAVKSIGLQFQGQWKLFEEFHRKNVTKAYAELEWED